MIMILETNNLVKKNTILLNRSENVKLLLKKKKLKRLNLKDDHFFK
jgi:hypothetical protein